MARKKAAAARRGTRKLWTATDLKSLRSNAGKSTVVKIAKMLKRSAAAVRFRASQEGISLRQKKR
jgi:hypothetical protein